MALDILDGDKVLGFARENDVDFVMIGPEAPLVEGVADVLRDGGRARCSGPSRAAARLEASKAFTKEICAACGAPTAAEPDLHRPGGGARLRRGPGRADRGQGRRARRGQGRDGRGRGGGGAGGARGDLRERARARGW